MNPSGNSHAVALRTPKRLMWLLLLGSSKRAKVLFDYAATADNQINLKSGQIITVVNFGGKGGWSKGVEIATGIYNCIIDES